MSALSVASPLLLRHIFRPPLLTLHSFLKLSQPSPISFRYLSLSSSPVCSLTAFNSVAQTSGSEFVYDDDEGEEIGSEIEDLEGEEERAPPARSAFLDSSRLMSYNEMVSKLPSLSVKEKKELASYAHSLGKKLKSQQVGKSGVTDAVATALIETLESKELLKLKIHGSCPGELDEVFRRLESSTGSIIISQIGRTVILYRPSLTKFKAEEKKRINQITYAKKQLAWRSAQQNRRSSQPRDYDQASSGHGQRGRSRY